MLEAGSDVNSARFETFYWRFQRHYRSLARSRTWQERAWLCSVGCWEHRNSFLRITICCGVSEDKMADNETDVARCGESRDVLFGIGNTLPTPLDPRYDFGPVALGPHYLGREIWKKISAGVHLSQSSGVGWEYTVTYITRRVVPHLRSPNAPYRMAARPPDISPGIE